MSANIGSMPRAPERPVLVAPFDGGMQAPRRARSQFTPLAIVALSVAAVLLAATVFLFVSKNSVSADLDAARSTIVALNQRVDTMKGTIAGLEEENAALTSENAALTETVTVARNSWESTADWLTTPPWKWASIASRINEELRELFDGIPPVTFNADNIKAT